MRERHLYAEPFKIKMVEPIRLISHEERKRVIKEAHYNLFNLKAEDVYIDFLSDSGCSAMSTNQWAGMMLGDEAYAGCKNFFHMKDAVKDIFGYEYMIITHQGRAAENILMNMFVKPGDIVLGNMHFDTTIGHIGMRNATPVNLICPEGLDTSSTAPFKGNIDLNKLEEAIEKYGREKIPFILITVTCNNNGGQPVSMANIKAASTIAKKNGIPLFFDTARYAENCYFIKTREPGYENKSTIEIACEMFSYGDGATMSSKKDALVNIGGFIAFKDNPKWYEQASQFQICFEGFKTYGGLSGRDIEALARGLYEGIDEEYLEDRTGQIAYLGDGLMAEGIPIQGPAGGHGIYIDARKMLPHIPQDEFPAQSLVIELYEEGGIRGCEIGSSALGYRDKNTGEYVWPELDMVRLAVPRRVYTDRHMDMVIEALKRINKRKDQIRGMKRTYEASVMAHFTARFEKL